jgi:hypothetical protein
LRSAFAELIAAVQPLIVADDNRELAVLKRRYRKEGRL